MEDVKLSEMGLAYDGDKIILNKELESSNVMYYVVNAIEKKEKLYHEIKMMEYKKSIDTDEYREAFKLYRALDRLYVDLLKMLKGSGK